MSMTSVVCNVPVLSHISSFYLHDMKVTSLRYLDAKFHHPSLGASPPNRGESICLPPELSLLLKRRSVIKFRHRYSMLWRTVGYPSTSWASCLMCVMGISSAVFCLTLTTVATRQRVCLFDDPARCFFDKLFWKL